MSSRHYNLDDEVPDNVPPDCQRISLIRDDRTDWVGYQVEDPDGSFYLCDADSDIVQIGEWTLLRVLADVPQDDPDAFFEAISQTARRVE